MFFDGFKGSEKHQKGSITFYVIQLFRRYARYSKGFPVVHFC
jgi:hypothetical protein